MSTAVASLASEDSKETTRGGTLRPRHHRRRHQWLRNRPRRRGSRARGLSQRDGRSCERHFLAIDRADPRWAALPRILRFPPRAGGAARTRSAVAHGAPYRASAADRAALPPPSAARVAAAAP